MSTQSPEQHGHVEVHQEDLNHKVTIEPSIQHDDTHEKQHVTEIHDANHEHKENEVKEKHEQEQEQNINDHSSSPKEEKNHDANTSEEKEPQDEKPNDHKEKNQTTPRESQDAKPKTPNQEAQKPASLGNSSVKQEEHLEKPAEPEHKEIEKEGEKSNEHTKPVEHQDDHQSQDQQESHDPNELQKSDEHKPIQETNHSNENQETHKEKETKLNEEHKEVQDLKKSEEDQPKEVAEHKENIKQEEAKEHKEEVQEPKETVKTELQSEEHKESKEHQELKQEQHKETQEQKPKEQPKEDKKPDNHEVQKGDNDAKESHTSTQIQEIKQEVKPKTPEGHKEAKEVKEVKEPQQHKEIKEAQGEKKPETPKDIKEQAVADKKDMNESHELHKSQGPKEELKKPQSQGDNKPQEHSEKKDLHEAKVHKEPEDKSEAQIPDLLQKAVQEILVEEIKHTEQQEIHEEQHQASQKNIEENEQPLFEEPISTHEHNDEKAEEIEGLSVDPQLQQERFIESVAEESELAKALGSIGQFFAVSKENIKESSNAVASNLPEFVDKYKTLSAPKERKQSQEVTEIEKEPVVEHKQERPASRTEVKQFLVPKANKTPSPRETSEEETGQPKKTFVTKVENSFTEKPSHSESPSKTSQSLSKPKKEIPGVRIKNKANIEVQIRQHRIQEIREIKQILKEKMDGLEDELDFLLRVDELEKANEQNQQWTGKVHEAKKIQKETKEDRLKNQEKALDFARRMNQERKEMEHRKEKREEVRKVKVMRNIDDLLEKELANVDLVKAGPGSAKSRMLKNLKKMQEQNKNIFASLEEKKQELKQKREFSKPNKKDHVDPSHYHSEPVEVKKPYKKMLSPEPVYHADSDDFDHKKQPKASYLPKVNSTKHQSTKASGDLYDGHMQSPVSKTPQIRKPSGKVYASQPDVKNAYGKEAKAYAKKEELSDAYYGEDGGLSSRRAKHSQSHLDKQKIQKIPVRPEEDEEIHKWEQELAEDHVDLKNKISSMLGEIGKMELQLKQKEQRLSKEMDRKKTAKGST